MDGKGSYGVQRQKLNIPAYLHRAALFLLFFLACAGYSLHPALAALQQGAVSFSDIPGHWAQSEVMRLATLELVKGYPDRTYRPDQLVDRLETVVLIIRAGGFADEAEKRNPGKAKVAGTGAKTGKAPGASENKPVATPRVPWGQAYLDLAVEKGFLLLDNPEEFDYAGPATRLEVARLLARALYLVSPGATAGPQLSEKNGSFADGAADVKPFSDEATVPPEDQVFIRAVAAAGVMTGYPDGTFRPGQYLTRADMAVILSRLIDRGWVKATAGRRLAGWISRVETQKGRREVELTSLTGTQKLQVPDYARCYRDGKEWPLEQALNFRCEVITDGRRQAVWINLLEQRDSRTGLDKTSLEKIRGSVKSVALGEDNLLVLSDMNCENRALLLAWDAVVEGKNARQGFKSLKPGDFVDVELARGQVYKTVILDVKTISGTVARLDGRRLYLKEGSSGNRPGWFNCWDWARIVDKNGIRKGSVSAGDQVKITYLDPFPGEIDDEVVLEIKTTNS